MLNLQGQQIYLRALEPTDLDFLYRLENNTNVWEISGTITPYAKHVLKSYLANAQLDIYQVKQLRLAICDRQDAVIGLIDLFDFDPVNHRAGMGIIVLEEQNRNQGAGTEAVSILCDYVFATLQLKQVYANILEDNVKSKRLFEKMGFEPVGVKKAWIFQNGTYKNEILYQKIRH